MTETRLVVCSFSFFVSEAYIQRSQAKPRPTVTRRADQRSTVTAHGLLTFTGLPGPSASMAEGSLSVSVPAWRLRTDTEIGGGISKLNVANLRTGKIRIRSRICALRCLRCDLKQIHGICNCACVRTCAAYCACAIPHKPVLSLAWKQMRPP